MTKSSKVLRKIISDFYMVLILIFLYAPILTMMSCPSTNPIQDPVGRIYPAVVYPHV